VVRRGSHARLHLITRTYFTIALEIHAFSLASKFSMGHAEGVFRQRSRVCTLGHDILSSQPRRSLRFRKAIYP
jgi:hypothetical protein